LYKLIKLYMNFYWVKDVINLLYFYLAYFIEANYEKSLIAFKKILILRNWFQKDPENVVKVF
jgi:hypothetical protein